MGSCIICGASVEGHVCDSHQEDVAFEFTGSRPEQLTPGRFYKGTVDGYADFGVFVNIGESVTGLLHRSKLDTRLESLDWEPGDAVFVQVTNVRDNGDVDLGWSIRQDERDFRGRLVDDPSGDRLPEAAADAPTADDQVDVRTGGDRPDHGRGDRDTSTDRSSDPADEDDTRTDIDGRETADGGAGTTLEPPETAESVDPTDLPRTPIAELADNRGTDVRLEGRVVSATQTSGPTVFELRDETGTVDCAAFVEAGVRAYPEVDVDDVVRLTGEVRTRRDELQVETDTLAVLGGAEADGVAERLDAALTERATPESVTLLADDAAIEVEAVSAAATTIRRAVIESRPIVVRHPATADGYVAGAAIERAVLPLIEAEHEDSDAVYHFFDRRPLEGRVYDMDDATRDVTNMLDDQERHGEAFPLFVFAGAAHTADSLDGLAFLEVYDASRVVLGDRAVDDDVAATVDAVVTPADSRTVATVASNVAAAVNDAVRGDLAHLPATSYWTEPPAAYRELAREAGMDSATRRELREAIALQAFYQSYEDKRELVGDILFDRGEVGDGRGLAAEISDQFRTKLETELETATANLERRPVDGTTIAVLDTDAFTHRFDFPPADLLLDELHRQADEEAPVTVGVGEDEVRIRATPDVDLDAIAARARETAPAASIAVRGTHIEFLVGEREAAVDAVLDAIASEA